MNIIKKLSFLWKAWRNTLSIEEFSFLVGLADNSFTSPNDAKDARFAQKVLKLRFKYDLATSEADIVAQSNDSVRDLWLKTLHLSKKSLTETETEMLVRRMPWHSFRRFPVALDDYYISILFAERNPLKIVAYCRDFALPENFELELIKHCNESLFKTDAKMTYHRLSSQINGWIEALCSYIDGAVKESKLLTESVQKELLDLRNPLITKKLIERCNMEKNILQEKTMMSLINQENENALRLLLAKSYLPNYQHMRIYFNNRYKHLIPQKEIADCRKELYDTEMAKKVLLGAFSMLPREHLIDLKRIETPTEYLDEYEELFIKPLLRRSISPAFGAEIAYHFPHLAKEVKKAVIRYTDACNETFAKK